VKLKGRAKPAEEEQEQGQEQEQEDDSFSERPAPQRTYSGPVGGFSLLPSGFNPAAVKLRSLSKSTPKVSEEDSSSAEQPKPVLPSAIRLKQAQSTPALSLPKKKASGPQDEILSWCKKCTAGYKNVNVTNLTSSWEDGLAFCALIHYYSPRSLDFDSLIKENKAYNLKLAFDTAESLGVVRLLDWEDMVNHPPERLRYCFFQTSFFLSLQSNLKIFHP
jgi:hypothetical protein